MLQPLSFISSFSLLVKYEFPCRPLGQCDQLLYGVSDADAVGVHGDEGGAQDLVRRDEDGARQVRRRRCTF